MKNALLKFAGFFVEKVPVEQPVGTPPRPTGAPAQPQQPQHPAQPGPAQQALHGHFPSPSGSVAHPQQQQPVQPAGAHAQLALALRAWVPQEYASYLAPFGLHVIAAGGELTVEQARSYGAQVLVVSAECLGSHTHLLSHPQLPTVFVAPQPVMLPNVPGVVQVQEPLRASDVAAAARDAVAAWTSARG